MNICLCEYVYLGLCLFAKLTTGDKAETTPTTHSLKTNLNELTIHDEDTNTKINSILEQSLHGSTDSIDQTKDSSSKTTLAINIQNRFSMKDFKFTTLKDYNFEQDEDPEADSEANCLADVSPEKIEAVRQTLKNDGGRVKFVSADPLLFTDEEKKIVSCLKKASIETKPQDETENTNTNTDKNNVGSEKGANDLDTEAVGRTNATETKISNETSQRRDYEYQFQSLQYYDEEMAFNDNKCPDLMDIIYLQISEVKHYDLECERVTNWTMLTGVESYLEVPAEQS